MPRTSQTQPEPTLTDKLKPRWNPRGGNEGRPYGWFQPPETS